MLKKKPEPSESDPDIATEEEHAYEGAWYRSLKAKAAHRAKDRADQPEQDEPEAPADEEPVAG
jgi:hypothetical protein